MNCPCKGEGVWWDFKKHGVSARQLGERIRSQMSRECVLVSMIEQRSPHLCTMIEDILHIWQNIAMDVCVVKDEPVSPWRDLVGTDTPPPEWREE